MPSSDYLYLDCPSCAKPCTAIPSCNEAHECGVAHQRDTTPVWCEDRTGTCLCGARLYVDIDDGYAELREEDE